MKRVFFGIMIPILLVSILVWGISVQPAKSSPNVLINGDFETGTFYGWNHEWEMKISNTTVHSGNYSAYILDDGDNWIDQTLMLPADTYFQFTGWIYPTIVGLLSGEYCDCSIFFVFYNRINMTQAFTVQYMWSGYPTSNTTTNLAFVPSFNAYAWNFVSVDLTSDILSYFKGIDLSQFVLHDILLLSHYSNTSPGEFYADDLSLSSSQQIVGNLSPQNTSYNVTPVHLTFTIYESTCWMGYSLDNQSNVTISGNTTLTGLTVGQHSIIVYVNNTFGNMGYSEVVNFEVVQPRTIIVPDDYPTIQAAIDAASDGDTVFVKNGTYYENVVANKTVSLVGENRDTTIIDGRNSGYVVDVVADNVSVSQLTLQNAGSNWSGINVESSGTVIWNNSMIDNHGGVWVRPGSLNTTISGNKISNKQPSYADGIRLWSSGTLVIGNAITNESTGIGPDVSGNTIRDNLIANNSIGIGNSPGSMFLHNSFINNSQQATLGGINIWDNGCEGNYWSDYNGTDSNHDGIGDTPYVIDANNIDHYPMMLMNVYWNPCDINHDLKVDMRDLGIAARAFNTVPGDALWNPHANITGPEYLVPDGKVDMKDLGLIARHFLEYYS